GRRPVGRPAALPRHGRRGAGEGAGPLGSRVARARRDAGLRARAARPARGRIPLGAHVDRSSPPLGLLRRTLPSRAHPPDEGALSGPCDGRHGARRRRPRGMVAHDAAGHPARHRREPRDGGCGGAGRRGLSLRGGERMRAALRGSVLRRGDEQLGDRARGRLRDPGPLRPRGPSLRARGLRPDAEQVVSRGAAPPDAVRALAAAAPAARPHPVDVRLGDHGPAARRRDRELPRQHAAPHPPRGRAALSRLRDLRGTRARPGEVLRRHPQGEPGSVRRIAWWSVVFAVPMEFQVNVILQGSWGQFAGAVLLYAVIGCATSRTFPWIAARFAGARRGFWIALCTHAAVGLVAIEWGIMGHAPGNIPDPTLDTIAQAGMFAWWGT